MEGGGGGEWGRRGEQGSKGGRQASLVTDSVEEKEEGERRGRRRRRKAGGTGGTGVASTGPPQRRWLHRLHALPPSSLAKLWQERQESQDRFRKSTRPWFRFPNSQNGVV